MSSFSNEKNNQVIETFTSQIDDNDTLSAMVLGANLVFPAVLNAAIQLKLFEIIGDRSMSPFEIASKLPTQHSDLPNRLDRMLRLLASYSLLSVSTRDENGITVRVYAATNSGKYFNNDENSDIGYFGYLTSFLCHPALMGLWLNFKDVVLNPEVDLFKKVNGISKYEYMEKDPQLNKIFNNAMTNTTKIHMKKILEIYKGFEGISTLVDVGGGNGQTLKMIIAKYPSIKGINFDLPQVIEHLSPFPGIEHIGGNMFESIPKGDAILLKVVCHNWSDEKCIEILNSCYKALSKNGKVILVEFTLKEYPEASNESQFISIADNMMFINDGGKERTAKEFEKLAQLCGFSRLEVVCYAISAIAIIELYK